MENMDFHLIDRYGTLPGDVTRGEVLGALARKNAAFAKADSDRFFNGQRDAILHVVMDRFGLGRVMAAGDQTGGNVDTVHNARAEVYATDAERQRYENRGEYNSADYHHNNEQYIRSKREATIAQKNGTLKDGYTGQIVKRNQKIDQDHINSAKSIHDDAGRVLAGEDGPELANQDWNLTQTDRSNNRAKKDKSAMEYADQLDRTRGEQQRRIEELQSKKTLTDKERNKLNKLRHHESVNTEEMRRKGKYAEAVYENTVNMKYYFSRKFITNLGLRSAVQGAQMGMRQIAGFFLVEAIAAAFDEIRDTCRNARKMTGSWASSLLFRIKRILNHVSSKWREALQAGLTGSISGLLSNILTVIINAFVTTAKNIVRLIREGFFSIVQAIKLLVDPPVGISASALYHEAGKIVIAGCAVTFGVILEESFYTFPPMLAIKSVPVLGPLLGDIVYGLMVAIITALALWGWDKLDIFNAKEERRHAYVKNELRKEYEAVR